MIRMSVGDAVDRLAIVNIKISLLEADIRQGRERALGLEEVGRRALQIRDLNKERVALKNHLNAILDPDASPDVKVAHRSA